MPAEAPLGTVVVAIDGPSASGKSTVARHIAERLTFAYVDSGSFYRGITWNALRMGIDIADTGALIKLIDKTDTRFFLVGNAVRFTMDGKDPEQELRSPAVAGSVSRVAAVPEVRTRVGTWLRDALRFGNLVVEGRDIGSVVFPEAIAKFYLDASEKERARRRLADYTRTGAKVSLDAVRGNIASRDNLDSRRKTAPLAVAPGAIKVDTTGKTIEQVVDEVFRSIPR